MGSFSIKSSWHTTKDSDKIISIKQYICKQSAVFSIIKHRLDLESDGELLVKEETDNRIPHGDSDFFLCRTLVTRRKHLSPRNLYVENNFWIRT